MTERINHAQAEREGQATPAEEIAVPHLRFLRLLVGGLAVAMVLGLAAIVAILWLRLSEPALPPPPALPAAVVLPEGAEVEAVTFAGARLIIVTRAGEVLVYSHAGELIQTIGLHASGAD
ncbi:MAG: DUF6476 family protein [Paracoccus sp. (in: a-proteobacteria)]|nr:DUF6476 family protein [Paracoccus sp. (in: a-proteobacteria)]